MTRNRLLAILAASATALFVSACNNPAPGEAGDGHTDHSHDVPTIEITGEPAGFDADDVAFATNMIPHHEQAVELSALVPDRSTNAELLALAKQISAAQEPEITTMKAFLVQWSGGEDNPSSGHDGHGGHGDMAGMVDEATMAKLKTLQGPEFDKLWLESMIAHHQGAVEMAKAELANGVNADAKTLAQHIIDAQEAEIAQMQKMLGS
ncbi:DUF305 domain-containing protein [Mycolicibacterium confluentis]|uniref:Uncharacterized protein n=1 Tax=Mycolicibacterium confluentis TaxID=28047 RepID=A0A7I7Y2J5_9MYCO|nr:DUF305 domain-containing protein [Mycolicibacterium confluentis]MCV7322894.1 DUF305 domain-containing protein [Mycolicibacterium confluentis]ORV20660.1 DUF305 domain-containing protein [Mycolicibacterium confluentis]BBZ35895.1 hypothetical protein MCNF_45000 [Mycolicibacterium confluentis]